MNAKEKAAAEAAEKAKAEKAKKEDEEKAAAEAANANAAGESGAEAPEATPVVESGDEGKPKEGDPAPTPTPDPIPTSTKETQSEKDAAMADKVKGQKFAFCRILGGLVVSIKTDGEAKNVLLRSAAEKSVAGDKSTLKFDLNSTDYGITVLSKEEAAACEKALKTSKVFKKKFVFFAENLNSGKALAKKFYEMHKSTGFEQLNMADIEKAVQKYEAE